MGVLGSIYSEGAVPNPLATHLSWPQKLGDLCRIQRIMCHLDKILS